MESFLLHVRLLPRGRDGLFPLAHLLLHAGLHHLPRPPAALRPVEGPVGKRAADSRHGAGLSRHPGRDGGGRGGAQEDGEARGESAVPLEHGVEALAAALPLHTQPALPVNVIVPTIQCQVGSSCWDIAKHKLTSQHEVETKGIVAESGGEPKRLGRRDAYLVSDHRPAFSPAARAHTLASWRVKYLKNLRGIETQHDPPQNLRVTIGTTSANEI